VKFSSLARPPIQPAEAEKADTSICPNHEGIVRFTGDAEGKVYWCPQGREFWRYTLKRTGMNAPLNYQHEKAI
jgi:hypothetical protein